MSNGVIIYHDFGKEKVRLFYANIPELSDNLIIHNLPQN